jgi:hypothetical protein
MYACIPEIGCGFFAGVCTLSNTTANFHDPPRVTIRELTPANGQLRKSERGNIMSSAPFARSGYEAMP